MYKEWLKEQLKKVETMTAYTIYKAELDRIERIETLLRQFYLSRLAGLLKLKALIYKA